MMRISAYIALLLSASPLTSYVGSQEIGAVANTILGEARGEGVHGMALVADVIHTRLNSPAYPNTPLAVVKQPKQFHGAKYRCKDWDSFEALWAVELAKLLVKGKDPVPTVQYTHFWSGNKKPSWAKGEKPYKFRNHQFVRLD